MEVTRDLLSSLKYNQLRSIAAKLGIGGVGKKSDLVDKIHGVRHDRRSIELLTVELGEPLALSESDGVAEDPENRESDECVELRQEELDLLDPRRESSRVSEDEKEKLRQILREQQHNLDCPIDSDEDGEDPSIWREVQAKLPEGDSDKRTRLSQTSMQSPLDSIQKTPSVAEVDGEILSSVAKNLQKNFRFGSAGDVVEDVALVQEQSRIEDFYQSPTEIDDDCSCSLSAHEESASQRSATSRGSTARNLSRSNDPLSGSKTLFDELDRVHANLNVENAKSTHGERQSSAEAVSDFAKGEDATVTSTLQSKQETPSSIEVNLTETVSQPDLGSPEWINDKDTLGPLPTIASARKSSLGSGDGVSVNKLSVMLSSMQGRLNSINSEQTTDANEHFAYTPSRGIYSMDSFLVSDEKGTEKDYSVATISERNSLQANSDDSASTQNSRRSSRGNIAKPEKVSRGGRIVKPDADDNQSVSSASSVGSSISGRSSHHSKGRKDATPKQDRDTSKPKSTVKQGNTMSLHALALSELGVESTDVDNAVNNASSLVKQDENIEYKHSASKVKESSLLFGAAGVALPERKKSFEVHSAPHSRSPTPVSQSPPRDEEVKSTPSTEKKPHPHLTVDTFQSEQQRGRSKEVVDSATKPANAAQTQNSKRNRSLTPTSLSKHGIYFGDNGSSTPSAAGGKAKSRSSTPTNLVTSASAPVLERASSATPKFSSEKGIARTPSASGSLGTSRGRSTTPRSSATTAVVPEARSARSITPNAAGRSTNTQAVSSALRSSSTSSSRSMTAPNRGKALSSSTAKSTQKSTTDKLNTLDTLASVSKKKPTDLSIRTSVNVKPTTQVRAIGNSTGNMPSSPSYRAANRSNSTASASTNGSRSNTPTGIPKPVFNKPVTSSLSRTTASTAARTTALTGQRNGTVSNNSSRAMSNTRLNIGKSEGSRVSTFARTGTAPTPLSKTSNSSSFGSARGDRSKSSSSATPAAKASLRTTATPLDKSVRSTTATPRQSEQKTKPSLKTVAKSVVNKGAPLPTKLDPSLLAVPVSPGKVYMPSLKHSSQGAISKMYQSTLIDRSPHGSPQSYAAPTFFEDVEMDSNQNGSASDILSSTQPITVDGKTYISMDEVSKITAALKEITTGSTGSKSTNCRNEKPVSSENSRSGSISSTSASEKRAGEETHITKGPKGAATVLYNNRYMKPTAASKATTADKGVSPLRPADNPFQSIL